MLSGTHVHILRRNNNYQFIVTINNKNYGCSLDNTDINWYSIVYLPNDMIVNNSANNVAATKSYKPIWSWKISQYNVSDVKFEIMVKPQFTDRICFPNCLPVGPANVRPIYLGDTDGSVGTVLFTLFATGHLGIMVEGEDFLSRLLSIEDEVLNVLLRENFNEQFSTNVNMIVSTLDGGDIILEGLQPYLVISKGTMTPCTFLGDQTGDRFSNIYSDQFIIDLPKRITNINENIHVSAGNHGTSCNGNYMQNFTRTRPLDEDTYSGVKDYPVCFYDPKYKIMASHHGIISNDQRKHYVVGPITISIDEMISALDPVELAVIINKKRHAIINGKKFKTNRAISCRSLNHYFSVSTDHRSKPEALLTCS